MKTLFRSGKLFCLALFTCYSSGGQEKTAFQIASPWKAEYDIRSDIAIVYGINDTDVPFEERVNQYREKGYTIHFMTGIAWGQYQDYFRGEFDGRTHFDEGQVERNGETIWHGRDVPYVVPSASFLNYIKRHLKRAIDACVYTVHIDARVVWAEVRSYVY